MAIDEVPVQTERPSEPNPNSGSIIKTVLIVVAIAALAVGEFSTVHRMTTMRAQLAAQQSQLRDDFNGQLRNQVSNRLAAIQQQNAEELDAVKTESTARLNAWARRTGN